MTEAEDVLDALAGSHYVRLRGLDKQKVRRAALDLLLDRHATEFRQLLDSEARRLLDRRAQGLW